MSGPLSEKAPDATPTRVGPARTGPATGEKRGALRALYDWLLGITPIPQPWSDPPVPPPEAGMPVRVGRYTILRKLGQGGMGVVYAARDDRLARTVALKTLSSLASDDTARRRFWREARAAASVNHPNVCQLYEIGEDGDELFIAMELLEGEPLADRLRRGPLSVAEAVPIGLEVLAALSALHALGIVHRDLKPSNVFLTSHGVKLLDFGLARPCDPEVAQALGSATELTRTGAIVGTPRYMAPEQITGEALDARTDLFAVGALLFEMLAGRRAFDGQNVVEILHATLHEQPPALTGSPAVAAADRVIRKALAKRPSERPASADAMARDLRTAGGADGADTPALARPMTRLVVLPFRVLRPDPETDFLAFSLPDAIASSLSGIASLVVRSGATAARFAGESPDLKALASEVDVDLVVMGTLLRSGQQLRAATQLVEAPAGALLASHTVQSSLGDLFRLQDDIAQSVVASLSLPLAGRGSRPAPDAPRSARAYEFYLRGNEVARKHDQLSVARDLYLRCLDEDPDFAPAWAHLGRCYRVIGKYLEDGERNYARAEKALLRALELSPQLSVAHKLYADLEADTGHASQALVRLLSEAGRRGNDPELFAGLVHACRYCGLMEQSIAAHEEARRLDPHVPTSLEQTLLMTGDIERILEMPNPDPAVRAIGLVFAGRRDEARQTLLDLHQAAFLPAYRLWTQWVTAWVDRRRDDMSERTSELNRPAHIRIMEDPEAPFQEGWLLCEMGEHELGLARLRRAVAGGFYARDTLARHPAFDALRQDPRFGALLAEAEGGRQRALAAFREAGGERLLGRQGR